MTRETTASMNSLKYRAVEFIGLSILRTFDHLVSLLADDSAILDPKDFVFTVELSGNLEDIRAEWLALSGNTEVYNVKDFYKVRSDVGHDDNWKMFPLRLFNFQFLENSSKCPKTQALVERIPGCTTAMFSVLGPGKKVPPHRGIYKGTHRCLFSIMVPDERLCWLKVGDRKIEFKEGETIVFDETFLHEAANESDYPRVVLYLDIYRNLPFPINIFNRLIFSALRRSPFIQNVLKEYRSLDPVTISDVELQG
jgi:aspartyl/asparaginyl beta-hydroxylase (cupin superfamily)